MAQRKRKRRSHKDLKQLNLRIVIGAALIVLAVLILVAASVSINLQLHVNGGVEPLVIVYGKDTYKEPGATATANGEDVAVTITGSVNDQKLGSYMVTYQARYLWMSKTVKREVRVVDTTAPIIILNTIPGHVTLPGEDYEEEGFTAIDDYDGDITDQVRVSIKKNVVYYTVTDSSGNQTKVERPIIRVDLTEPLITLEGETNITINAGEAYVEPGYSALDDIDGDITHKVEISGSVNIYHAGTYTLIYSVTDSQGNTTTAERTVEVKPIKQPSTVNPGSKVIYLTFDDGPRGHTQRLLDILEQYNAKATFFVIDTGNTKLLKAIVDDGHGIAIHSTTHKYEEIYASEEAFFNDLYNMQKIIKNATGVTTTMMRFPGGSSNTISKNHCEGIMTQLTQAVQDQGFQYFDWNVSSGDAGNTTDTAQIVSNVITGVQSLNGRPAVVLQHDIHGYSVDAVEQILIWGINNGYTFQALTPSSPICHHTVNN